MTGRIITFYSYKGGIGRTQTLADVAWVLASQGERVLVVDWDLESPALHRYFHRFLPDGDLRFSPGVMDLVWEFATAAVDPATPDEPRWHERFAAIQPYTVSVEHDFPGQGAVALIPAGRQDDLYPSLVTTFDWDNFYERLGGGGFVEALKRNMRERYDYVLVDSPTGLGDTAGICAVQLPDILVNCFALTNQAIDGAAAVTAAVQRQRAQNEVRVFPVPLRDGRNEVSRSSAYARLGRHLSHVPDPEGYWAQVGAPSPTITKKELLEPVSKSAVGHIVAYLTERLPASGPARGRRVFLTYAYDSADHFEAVRELWFLLRSKGIDARLDRPPGQRRADWPNWQRQQLLAAELVLPVPSPGWAGLPADETAQLRKMYAADPQRFLPVVVPGTARDGLPDFLDHGPASRRAEAFSLTLKGVKPLAELIKHPASPFKVPHPGPVGRGLAAAGQALAEAMLGEQREALSAGRLGDRLPLRWSLSDRWGDSFGHGRMAVTSGELSDSPDHFFTALPTAHVVLVGSPGSGKTTALRLLASALLDKRASDESVPVPVMLHLAAWDPSVRTLTDWIVQQVRADHPAVFRGLGPAVLARLVEEGWVLPFLDGLDELPAASRVFVLEAVRNDSATKGGYVLSSRTGAYVSAICDTGPLPRSVVLGLEPLRAEEVLTHLRRALPPNDTRWDPVLHHLVDHPSHPLLTALKRPFLLQLATATYQLPSTDPVELLGIAEHGDVEAHLLDSFVATAYGTRPPFGPSRDSERWLTFLAARMDSRQTRDFAWWELDRVFGTWGLRLRLGVVSLLLSSPLLILGLASQGSPRTELLTLAGATAALGLFAPARPSLPPSSLLQGHRHGPTAAALLAPFLFGGFAALLAALASSFTLVSALAVFLMLLVLTLGRSASARYAVALGWLAARGRAPWRLMRFLDDASRRGVLYRGGGVYRFRHARVQEFLADRSRQE